MGWRWRQYHITVQHHHNPEYHKLNILVIVHDTSCSHATVTCSVELVKVKERAFIHIWISFLKMRCVLWHRFPATAPSLLSSHITVFNFLWWVLRNENDTYSNLRKQTSLQLEYYIHQNVIVSFLTIHSWLTSMD